MHVNEIEEATPRADAAAAGVEATGATVEAATAQALAELGAEPHDVVVEVISRAGARPRSSRRASRTDGDPIAHLRAAGHEPACGRDRGPVDPRGVRRRPRSA